VPKRDAVPVPHLTSQWSGRPPAQAFSQFVGQLSVSRRSPGALYVSYGECNDPKSWTVLGHFSRQRYGNGLLQPLRFEHRWRQVSQGRLEALPRIDLVQKAAKVLVGVMKVKVLMERDFLFQTELEAGSTCSRPIP
jgi:hypothetical protein